MAFDFAFDFAQAERNAFPFILSLSKDGRKSVAAAVGLVVGDGSAGAEGRGALHFGRHAAVGRLGERAVGAADGVAAHAPGDDAGQASLAVRRALAGAVEQARAVAVRLLRKA